MVVVEGGLCGYIFGIAITIIGLYNDARGVEDLSYRI